MATTSGGRARALFVTDLDATLLDRDREIPRRNLEGIARANAAGVAVAIVTGRRRSSVDREYGKLDGLRYRVSTSNGSVVLAADNLWAEWVQPLDWGLVDAIAAGPAAAGVEFLCVTAPARSQHDFDGEPDCFVLDEDRRWWTSHTAWDRDSLRPVEREQARRKEVVHFAARLPSRERAEEVAAWLDGALPATATTHVVTAPVGEGALAEVVPRGGKGLAVRYLVEALGIDPDATAAVGDELNDCDLLDAARHRYAVGGSRLARDRPDAAAVASAEEGAVGDAIDRFLAELG